MARNHGMDDLFGHVPQKGEPAPSEEYDASEIFSDDNDFDIMMRSWPRKPNVDSIRDLVHRLIAEARGISTLDWSAEKLRFITGMFPYLAEWLKNGEGDQLMAEFKAEMDRLNAPADIVAPNWREIWNIAA